MQDHYGSDFLTIADEDGNEYELEVLTTVEYNGSVYYAVIPADGAEEQSLRLEVSILKSVDEDGESVLCIVEDEQEADAVNRLIMDALYDDADSIDA